VGAKSRRQHPFLDSPGPIPFAHRGGASDAPENTMAAFRLAVELGYRYLETDVHVTNDGEVVAFHDDDLQRTCGIPHKISELPWSEVAKARVDGLEPIPRLVELFEEWPDARINIDCKDERALQPLATLLQRLGVLDRVMIGSFLGRRMGRARRLLGTGVCTSAGTYEVVLFKFLRVAPRGPLALQVPVRQWIVPIVSAGFIRRAHAKGLAVHVWTIDDPVEMHRLLDLGVDGIMTDRLSVLRNVLIERGEWV